VFSIRVLRDERICIVAEQRPEVNEEDAFPWMVLTYIRLFFYKKGSFPRLMTKICIFVIKSYTIYQGYVGSPFVFCFFKSVWARSPAVCSIQRGLFTKK